MLFAMQGAILARSYPAPIVYRSKNARVASSAGTIPKPAGIAVGDIVWIVTGQDMSGGVAAVTTASGSVWSVATFTASSFFCQVFWKILDATDVAFAWNVSPNLSYVGSYAYEGRGALTVTRIETVVNAGGLSSLSFAGFAPADGHKGLVSILLDHDIDAADTAPSAFTSREAADYDQIQINVADRLAGWPGGVVTWTATNGAGTLGETGLMFEIT